jgi:hypothetical protein
LSIVEILGMAVLALLLFSWVYTSSTFEACVQRDTGKQEDNAEQKYGAFLSKPLLIESRCIPLSIGKFIDDARDSINLVATVAIALFTLTLWIATRDLVRDAEDTKERQLRAYVYADTAADRVIHIKVGVNTSVAFNIKNCGQTPARNVRVRGKVAFYELPQHKTTPELVPYDSKTIIHPGTHIELQMTATDETTAADVAGMRSGTRKLYIVGVIDYKDVFGSPQWTSFKLVAADSGGRVTYCEDGNDAT